MLESLPHFQFHCNVCRTGSALSIGAHCPDCGAPMCLQLTAYPDPGLFEARATSLWDFRAMLPLPPELPLATLGEGGTPLLDAPALASDLGLGAVGLKNEMGNPTGSFKDRQVCVGIHWARACGYDTVAVVSSGNVASSAAAYSARLGMRAVLFTHGHAAPAKIAQAQYYGATVIAVDDPSPAAVFRLCMEACEQHGWYHLSTAGIYEAWNVEGAKSIAYELYQQYNGKLPDWIIAPVGGGGLVGGIWRGLLDLQGMGLIQELPRLAGVQAEGCAPLLQAIENDWTLEEHLAHPWPDPQTAAGAIADDILFDGHTVLPAIRETWGAAIAVSDEAMYAAQGQLARQEGLLCELATASTIAGLRQLPRLDKRTSVCCIVSGSGLKDLGHLAEHAVPVPHIPATAAALEALLSGGDGQDVVEADRLPPNQE